jgi:hypothetical protein
LSIEFDLGCPNKVINNFHTKLKKLNPYWIHGSIENCHMLVNLQWLKHWHSPSSQVLSVLPNSHEETFIDIQNIFFDSSGIIKVTKSNERQSWIIMKKGDWNYNILKIIAMHWKYLGFKNY